MRFKVGWKIIELMIASLEPLRSYYRVCPPSGEKILISVPLDDADAIKVPSGLTARAPKSLSCA